MRTLIKIGGTLLDNPESRAGIAAQIAAYLKEHPSTVVVHGGGKQMTRFLAERGVENHFVDGLRVSSPEVIDAVLKVFAGTVNHELVASFVRAGVGAVGLTGVDAALVECEQLDPALGAVGKPVKANTGVLDALCRGGFTPVVACVGGDRQGTIYNVNADQMATAIAVAFHVKRLLFLTDVDGVRGAAGENLPVLTAPQAEALIADGVATGGMLAKLRSAMAALDGGVDEVLIVNGAAEAIVSRVAKGDAAGTRLISGEDSE